MVTKSKDFWVSNKTMEFINDTNPYTFTKADINKCKYDQYKNKITISWEEDRVATISESTINSWKDEFRDMTKFKVISSDDFVEIIKQKIFNKGEQDE